MYGWRDGRLSPFDGLLRAPYSAKNWFWKQIIKWWPIKGTHSYSILSVIIKFINRLWILTENWKSDRFFIGRTEEKTDGWPNSHSFSLLHSLSTKAYFKCSQSWHQNCHVKMHINSNSNWQKCWAANPGPEANLPFSKRKIVQPFSSSEYQISRWEEGSVVIEDGANCKNMLKEI